MFSGLVRVIEILRDAREVGSGIGVRRCSRDESYIVLWVVYISIYIARFGCKN